MACKIRKGCDIGKHRGGGEVTNDFSNKTFHELLTTLSLIIDYQEGKQLYHAWRVAVVAKHLSDEATPDDSPWLFYAGLLHDVGITGIGDHPADHPDLRESELAPWLRHHSHIGARIVGEIPGLKHIARYIKDHHEWWNGKGFPDAKEGDEIPLHSQIIRMADSFDVMLRVRPKLTRTDMYEYYRSHSGKEFSKKLWDVFRRLNNKDMGMFFYEIDEDFKVPFKLKEVISELPAVNMPLEDSFVDSILKVFGVVTDAKHSYTAGHTERVRQYSITLAKILGLPDKEMRVIGRAAYLHDIGKVAVPVSILDKPGPLTEDEWKVMAMHTVYTMELIDGIEALWDLSPIAGSSQEFYDGTGYPDGLKGDDIPIGSRIIAVADAMDAMTTDRAYRKALGWDVAISELKRGSGTQFDPNVVDAAITYIAKEKLENE